MEDLNYLETQTMTLNNPTFFWAKLDIPNLNYFFGVITIYSNSYTVH